MNAADFFVGDPELAAMIERKKQHDADYMSKYAHIALGSIWTAPSGKLVKVITPAPVSQIPVDIDPTVFFQRIGVDGRPGRYGQVYGPSFLKHYKAAIAKAEENV